MTGTISRNARCRSLLFSLCTSARRSFLRGAMAGWVKRKKSAVAGLYIPTEFNLASAIIGVTKRHPKDTLGSPEIQELDNGFFEKFGTLLQEQSHADGDSGVGDEASPDSSLDAQDSPDAEATADLITDAMGWNIEELYSEILYEILHNVGCDVESSEEQTDIIAYLQQAFHMDDATHHGLLEAARSKEAPNILLNVEVIEAKELRPKDANGLSDPFCTLYLASAPTHRYNTSVKSETLTPLWEEHFSLPVTSMSDDVLCLEVWDFDPAETVREKMTKIMEVKGVKGFRKLVKEIAVTASTGKHDNELVGNTSIALKSIPASGQMFWCPLEKKPKIKKQGNVKVKLSFSSEKNSQVSTQEYRHLLRLLLLHELDQTKIEPYQWSGNFSSLAKDILTQHVVQCGLSSAADSLAQWVEFASVHGEHHLSYTLFANLAERLVRSLKNGTLSDDEVKMFWEGTKKLLPSCISCIRKIRKLTDSGKHTQNQLAAILSICSALNDVPVPEDCDLFPSNIYGWLDKPTDGKTCDIRSVIIDAVMQGATDWYSYVVDNNEETDDSTEAKLRHLIKIITLLRVDIQKAIEFYDKIFQSTLKFAYAKTLYELYEEKICALAENDVRDACDLLKPLNLDDLGENGSRDEMLTMGTTLFELYLCLQRFSVLGTGLSDGQTSTYKINQYHQWFHRGVAQWLDIALYKALQRVERAAELDNLQPVDHTVKYSSSAVDTLAIFYQIKTFWKQLAWPDVEGSYSFVAKIIDDVCRCCMFYADQMTTRVSGIGDIPNSVYGPRFNVTSEWCLAINNIDYVRNSIPKFVNELGMAEIIRALSDYQSPAAADHCNQTLLSIIENAIDSVGNKILDLQETVADKMTPSISRFLLEGAELLNQESNSVDRLMQYLDENLIMLHNQLNDDNFQSMLNMIWEKVAKILYDLVETSLEKRRPPSFFSNLYITLQILLNFFKKGETVTDGDGKLGKSDQILEKVTHLLRIHGLETSALIHQYYLERAKSQENMPTDLGMLTVRVHFVESMLRIELMNARNLKAKDSGSCDPFVKIAILPDDKFVNTPKPKSKTHKKTTFPLYDEVFTVQLTSQQRRDPDALIQFVVKDSDFLGTEFLGEAFLSFSNIPESDDPHSLPQLHLTLHKPNGLNSDELRALEHRQGDKQAREFLKKLKTKQSH